MLQLQSRGPSPRVRRSLSPLFFFLESVTAGAALDRPAAKDSGDD
jgi:hypothetical protein